MSTTNVYAEELENAHQEIVTKTKDGVVYVGLRIIVGFNTSVTFWARNEGELQTFVQGLKDSIVQPV